MSLRSGTIGLSKASRAGRTACIIASTSSSSDRASVARGLSPPRWQNQRIQSAPASRSTFFAPRSFSTQHPLATSRGQESRRNADADTTEEELDDYDRRVAEDKDKQTRRPWLRQGSDVPPVQRQRSAGAMTKGKLLTTPSRLLKLILPLTTRDLNSDRKNSEPLALLVHPQQPLSYLERLIQAELPTIHDKEKSIEKIPVVNFKAQDVGASMEEEAEDRPEKQQAQLEQRGGPGEGGVEVYSGRGREMSKEEQGPQELVQWSKSTEIGDFIRDAARGREFAVVIEGAPEEIRVGVPSFSDRTYYLRTRLRRKAGQIRDMAKVKHECDRIAHRHARYLAYAGFGGLTGWAGFVAYLTFMTDLGWDVMEPVTYLVGMVGLLIGYAWFLSNRREASYVSAMHITVSNRQQKLYEQRGFDLRRWQTLIDDGNALRREIMHIATEYDVDWNERMDTNDESVIKALKSERSRQKNGKSNAEEEEEDEGEQDEAQEDNEQTKQRDKDHEKQKG